ncbi:zinc-binding dehydrogenase [Streptomyces sp. NPDC002825]|uniref:zinc-binding dehydrogenase n=1 Tax=Streptomyces sp. NPDC002825 TaxID=3154666 RepID=UPI00331AEB6D
MKFHHNPRGQRIIAGQRPIRQAGASQKSRDAALPPAAFDGAVDAAVLGEATLAPVRDAGAYVGVWPGQEPAPERDIRVNARDVRADGTRLAELSRLTDQGIAPARIARTFPLADAAAAHARLTQGGHARATRHRAVNRSPTACAGEGSGGHRAGPNEAWRALAGTPGRLRAVTNAAGRDDHGVLIIRSPSVDYVGHE